MIKVLIASPVRGGVSPSYVRNLIAILNANWGGKYLFNWAATSGTSVAWARDELADTALAMKYDKLLFWDVDLGTPDPKMMVAAVARLLSHNVDVVGAAYVGHNVISQFHGANNNEPPREDGLMSMGQIPLGFSLIDCGVFKKIRQTHPWHEYIQKETGTRPPKKMFEFFPTGICGPNTAKGKIERINGLLTSKEPIEDLEKEVISIIRDADYSANYVLGEDFYFCKLAREAGFTLYIDNNMIIPHESKVLLPLQTNSLLQNLSETWRHADNVKSEDVMHALEGLKAMMQPE